MKKIMVIYGSVLGALYLVNNYIQIIPFFDYHINDTTSGIISILLSGIVTLIAVNQVVKALNPKDSYSYSAGFIAGAITNLIGSVIFALISCVVLCAYGHCESILDVFFSRVVRLTIVGMIISAIVPLTYTRSAKETPHNTS